MVGCRPLAVDIWGSPLGLTEADLVLSLLLSAGDECSNDFFKSQGEKVSGLEEGVRILSCSVASLQQIGVPNSVVEDGELCWAAEEGWLLLSL